MQSADMAAVDVDNLPMGDAAKSASIKAPLLIWLLGKNVNNTAAMMEKMLEQVCEETPFSSFVYVWGKLDLAAVTGKDGESRIFIPEVSVDHNSDNVISISWQLGTKSGSFCISCSIASTPQTAFVQLTSSSSGAISS